MEEEYHVCKTDTWLGHASVYLIGVETSLLSEISL